MTALRRRRYAAGFAAGGMLLTLAAGACGGGSTAPTPQLQISCSAPAPVESATGNPVAVNFASTITTTGGTKPVTIACTPASGTSFPIGSTAVLCTAKDDRQQRASCNLQVTVTPVGALSATRFLAFGDSLTYGTLSGSSCSFTASSTTRDSIDRDFRFLYPRLSARATLPPPPPTAYPNVLQGLLQSRYRTQTPTVVNAGLPNELITAEGGGVNPDTLARLQKAIRDNAPQALLLMEGVNDIGTANHHTEAVPILLGNLRDLIREARRSNVRVFLATLPPEDRNGCRGIRAWDLIGPAASEIRSIAISEGATLVDVYEAFGGVPGPYVPVEDGLHLNELGYEKLAQTFFTSIRSTLEGPH